MRGKRKDDRFMEDEVEKWKKKCVTNQAGQGDRNRWLREGERPMIEVRGQTGMRGGCIDEGEGKLRDPD